jgi:hypothetical protein
VKAIGPRRRTGDDEVMSPSLRSAERERKGLHARIEELQLELSSSDRLRLSDHLIQPLLGDRAVALVVYIKSVRSSRRLAIDEHAKSNGMPSRCGSHDNVKIASLKAVRDPPAGFVQHSGVVIDRPIARKSTA